MASRSRLRRVLTWLISSAAVVIAAVLACNLWVWLDARPYVAHSVEAAEPRRVGLVLGTSPWAAAGTPNIYFVGRVETAAALMEKGTVQHLLLSGANPSKAYNEPRAMLRDLQERGIAVGDMTLDYAGLRTLDSLVRALEIFEVDDPLIITQAMHAHRAIFIARRRGLTGAVAVAAPTLGDRNSPKTIVRELGARVKAVIDLYVLRKQPKFLGQSEPIAGGGAE